MWSPTQHLQQRGSAVDLYWLRRWDGVNSGWSCAVQGGGVRRVRAGGQGAVGRRHRGHLPLEELQDHIDISCHSCLQPSRDREKHQKVRLDRRGYNHFMKSSRVQEADNICLYRAFPTFSCPALDSFLSLFVFPWWNSSTSHDEQLTARNW